MAAFVVLSGTCLVEDGASEGAGLSVLQSSGWVIGCCCRESTGGTEESGEMLGEPQRLGDLQPGWLHAGRVQGSDEGCEGHGLSAGRVQGLEQQIG